MQISYDDFGAARKWGEVEDAQQTAAPKANCGEASIGLARKLEQHSESKGGGCEDLIKPN